MLHIKISQYLGYCGLIGVTIILCLPGLALSQSPPTKPVKPYTWNRVLPPLMEKDPDIVSMGPEILCRPVRPPSTKTVDKEVSTSQQVFAWRRTTIVYSSTHQECWKRIRPPEWFALKRTEKVTITDGFDETQRTTVVETLSAELTAGSESTTLSAKLKADLQRTEETVRAWKTEKKTEVDIAYPENMWLTVWALIETVSASRTTTVTNSLGDQRQVTNTVGPTTTTVALDQVKLIYPDKATKQQMKKMNPKEFRE